MENHLTELKEALEHIEANRKLIEGDLRGDAGWKRKSGGQNFAMMDFLPVLWVISEFVWNKPEKELVFFFDQSYFVSEIN